MRTNDRPEVVNQPPKRDQPSAERDEYEGPRDAEEKLEVGRA
jgi:hypothetical protein